MTQALTRRRFLAISAAACAAPRGAFAAGEVARWRGVALGAQASITLAGLDEAAATPVFAAAAAEIARLEDIFSLYRPRSEISRLNAAGALAAPSPEMLELLSLSGAIHHATQGAFDPTVQPLWNVWAEATGPAPDATALASARAAVGWDGVAFDAEAIAFRRPGMALTLNGIAQGYIADRVAQLMRGLGLTDVLIDAGEIAALGVRSDGRPWRVGVAAPDGAVLAKAALRDRALATSAPLGTLLGAAGEGHILDPRTGASRAAWRVVSVSAGRAAAADGLSTAFCLLGRDEIDRALAAFPEARLEVLV